MLSASSVVEYAPTTTQKARMTSHRYLRIGASGEAGIAGSVMVFFCVAAVELVTIASFQALHPGLSLTNLTNLDTS